MIPREREQIAAILAAARAEALEHRPLCCATVNSITERLADMLAAPPHSGFDRAEFYALANYKGMTDGTTGIGLPPL